ncbi:MAG: biopolymer transporter ExbD [Deltaproteobacteria bacterium]|nr:biopolymer transporter ExbD [Deltaproteobacteria bacterium]
MADFGNLTGGESRRGRASIAGKFKKRSVVSTGMMLTSMLDILTTILFFLLKNYSDVVTNINVGKDITLPYSSSIMPPMPSLQLMVTKNAIILDDKPLVQVINGDVERKELYRDGVTIVKLAQALQQHKKRSLFVEQRSDTHSFTGTIALQADKDLRFNLLKKVIYTAGMVDFNMMKLAVLKRDQG